MTERLLQLPLFQGMSRADLQQVMAQTKFDFRKSEGGKVIVAEGDVCGHLWFVLDGELEAVTMADDHSYQLVELLSVPCVLQPEHVYGLNQRFSKTFRTRSSCHLLCIDKGEVGRLASLYDVFRINLLNILSTQSQRMAHWPLRTPPQTVGLKIAFFVAWRCLRPAGAKILHIKMERLGQLIGESRLNVSRCLNQMAAEKKVVLRRGRIEIVSLEHLLAPA